MEERHAHEVMEMMVDSGERYNRESLAAAIRGTFGMETCFYACSASGMDAETLIDFLEAKGKFSGPEDAFVFDPGQACGHH